MTELIFQSQNGEFVVLCFVYLFIKGFLYVTEACDVKDFGLFFLYYFKSCEELLFIFESMDVRGPIIRIL